MTCRIFIGRFEQKAAAGRFFLRNSPEKSCYLLTPNGSATLSIGAIPAASTYIAGMARNVMTIHSKKGDVTDT